MGIVYIARRDDGAWLLERRAGRGLLAGMLGWPGSDWSEQPKDSPPCNADWIRVPGEVRHEFTHFRLRLTVRAARLSENHSPNKGEFLVASDFDPQALPTLMRKAYAHALPALNDSNNDDL